MNYILYKLLKFWWINIRFSYKSWRPIGKTIDSKTFRIFMEIYIIYSGRPSDLFVFTYFLVELCKKIIWKIHRYLCDVKAFEMF